MPPERGSFVPIRYTLPWPEDLIPLPRTGPIADVLARIAIVGSGSRRDPVSGHTFERIEIAILGEIAVGIPGIEGLALTLNSTDGIFSLICEVSVQRNFELAFRELQVGLRVTSPMLRPARESEDGGWEQDVDEDGTPRPYQLDMPGVDIIFSTAPSLDLGWSGDVPTMTIPPALIGDSGFVIEVEALEFILSSESADAQGGNLEGVRLVGLAFHLPSSLRLDVVPTEFTIPEMVIGSGGVTGTVGAVWQADPPFDSETHRFSGSGTGVLFDIPFAMQRFSLEFRQNEIVGSDIAARLALAMFDEPLSLAIGFTAGGGFLLELSGEIDRLTVDGLLAIDVETIALSVSDVVTLAIAGTLTPLVGGLDWPTLRIDRLSIDSTGKVDIEGGWLNVPESFTLDFHAFKIELEKVGFGSDGEGDDLRNWIGLSGGVRLIEGIPLSASVEGLKVSWRPLPADPDVKVSLEGIAVHLEIPETLVLDGAVRNRELERPSDLAAGETEPEVPATGRFFGHILTGSIRLDLTAIELEIAGELVVGELTRYSYEDTTDGGKRVVPGESFVSLFILLSAELPTALPLGASGTGLYAMKGLFGMNLAPDRYLDGEGDPEPWYEWYKADRNSSGARNVTSVAKWVPRFDTYAFGAGVTFGTVYDDGFTINAGLLAAILIPGPVVMIEGRANLIKPRGKSSNSAEGALYALMVFDGIAETFQMNVDINYSLEDVITVGGGLEAFFDFNDGSKWYIYIGRKEPISNRVRAEVISIISASAYFMLDPNAIQFGANAGLDLQLDYGPLEIKLIFRVVFEVELFVKEPQFGGMIELYGEISVRIFGTGIGLILQAMLEGQAPQPWWIHGVARAALELPFPLPSFDVSVEFEWGESDEPARVDLVKGASMVHAKLPGAAWALVDATRPEEEWPVVPVDAIPAISLAKPLTDVSFVRLEDGTTTWFRTESPEGLGVEFGYVLHQIWLEEQDEAGGWTLPPRYSVSAPGRGELRFRPDEYALEPQVELLWFGPLDTFDKYSRRNYVDPCPVPVAPQRHCVNWRDVAVGSEFAPIFSRGGLALTSGIGHWPAVRAVAPTAPGEPDRGISVPSLTVHFPEPVAWVEVRCAVQGLSVTAGYRAGQQIVLPRSPSPVAWTLEPLGADYALSVDTLQFQRAPSALVQADPVVTSICWITLRELEASRRREDPEDRSAMRGDLVLRPHRTYRLSIYEARLERREGEERSVLKTLKFGFHTGGLPGTDYSKATEFGLVSSAPPFADGPLNRVESYVKRTVPPNGAPLFYRGYDVLVELSEPYAAAMLAPVIDVVIKDRNGEQIGGRPLFSFLTGGLPFVTLGLLSLLTAEREPQCSATPIPWERQKFERYIACALPEETRICRMYRVELLASLPYGPQTVYGFEFATSQFLDAREHLSSGLLEVDEPAGVTRGRMPLRHLGAAAAPPPPLDWIAPTASKVSEIADLREALANALVIGEDDAGITIANAVEALPRLRAALVDWMNTLYELFDRGGEVPAPWEPSRTLSFGGVHSLFEAVGLAHRPLPPKSVEALSIDVGAGYIILIESPEPLDWGRLTVRDEASSALIPVVWSGDGTRAFVFAPAAPNIFVDSNVALRFSYDLGGPAAPDLDPLYRRGAMPVRTEDVIWNLSASDDRR